MQLDPLAIFLKPGPAPLAPIELCSTRIEVRLLPPLACVQVARSFVNRRDVAIEGVLTLPLDPEAIVHGLGVVIDGAAFRATAVDAGTLGDDHELAIEQGRTSIRAERLSSMAMLVAVAPIAPGATVDVALEYVAPLAWLERYEARFSIPLSAEPLSINDGLRDVDALTVTGTRHPATLIVDGDGVEWRLSSPDVHQVGVPVAVDCSGTLEFSFQFATPRERSPSTAGIDGGDMTLRSAGRENDVLELTFVHDASQTGPASRDEGGQRLVATATREIVGGVLEARRYLSVEHRSVEEEDAVRAYAVGLLAQAMAAEAGQSVSIRNNIISATTGLAFVGDNGNVLAAPLRFQKVSLPRPRAVEAGLAPEQVLDQRRDPPLRVSGMAAWFRRVIGQIRRFVSGL